MKKFLLWSFGLCFGLVVLLLAIRAGAAQAQRIHATDKDAPASGAPFALKGDVLGETIQEFRSRNNRIVRTFPNAAVSETRQLPICTNDPLPGAYDTPPVDVEAGTESEEEQRDGVIKCVAALSVDDNVGFNDPGPTVAEIGAYKTVYSFFRGRLYEIESQLPGENYSQLRDALVVKYGTPSRKVLEYQNGFGARSAGERLAWRNGVSSIYLGELDGESNNSELIFWHDALRKECEAAGALERRGKDL